MVQALTDEDIKKFKVSERNVFILQALIFLPLAFLVSLLSGIFGSRSLGYWITVLFTITLMIAAYGVYLLFQLMAFRKDIACRQKKVETLKVTGKLIKDGKRMVWTDNESIKQFQLFHNNAFDLIQVGDILYVEETLHRRYLLRLDRDGENLLVTG